VPNRLFLPTTLPKCLAEIYGRRRSRAGANRSRLRGKPRRPRLRYPDAVETRLINVSKRTLPVADIPQNDGILSDSAQAKSHQLRGGRCHLAFDIDEAWGTYIYARSEPGQSRPPSGFLFEPLCEGAPDRPRGALGYGATVALVLGLCGRPTW
jgi:hypothetical protein